MLPPLPVHESVKVLVVAVSEPVDAFPLVALLPLQPPPAVQLVVFVEDHVRVDAAPLVTVVGLAEMVTVGGCAWIGAEPTVTVTEPCAVPPDPTHESVKVLVAEVSAGVASDPEVPLVPDHDPPAVQLVVLVEDQERVAVFPVVTVERFEFREMVGTLGMTTTGGVGGTYAIGVVLVLAPPPVVYPMATSIEEVVVPARVVVVVRADERLSFSRVNGPTMPEGEMPCAR